jgi:hypothetical protein
MILERRQNGMTFALPPEISQEIYRRFPEELAEAKRWRAEHPVPQTNP